MFKVGDTVLYGSDGVCKISEITQKVFGDTSIEYYVLTPLYDNKSTFFVPTKNEKLKGKMHYVLSADEIKSVIDNCDDSFEWIDNDAKRSEEFKEIISCGELNKIARLTKCITRHKDEIIQKGKKLHKSDEIIYKEAIKILYEEFAMVINVTKDDIADVLCKKISFEELIKTV